MKVTKARGLDTGDSVGFPCDQTVGRRPNAPSPCPVGCLRARQTWHGLRRPSTVWSVSPLSRYPHKGPTRRPSCAPRCGRVAGSAFASTDGRDGPDGSGETPVISHKGCAKAPSRAGRRRVRPSTDSLVECEPSKVAGAEGLCFGDFHLAPQMKVTRPAGTRPGAVQTIKANTTLPRISRKYNRPDIGGTASALPAGSEDFLKAV